MKTALVLFAHGAREPEWSAPFRRIQGSVAARCPGTTVELAYLEAMPPTLQEVLERLAATGHGRIVIAPLFMAQGGHLKRDLPRLLDALRRQHPALVLEVLPPVGEVENVLNAMSDWLTDALRTTSGRAS
ncbi:MAG: sirohydrochlorin chelatase [Betaproteobacteria bacterium]